jgi:hypothetical protein
MVFDGLEHEDEERRNAYRLSMAKFEQRTF